MDKGCGLQYLSRFFLRQSLRGQPAQVVVDQRQQLAGCVGTSYLRHLSQTTRGRSRGRLR